MQTVTIHGRKWPLPFLLEHHTNNRAMLAEQLAAARAANDEERVTGLKERLEGINRDLVWIVASAGPRREA